MKNGFGDGSKLYQKRAKQALPLLVAQAKARNTITYGQLASEMDMPNARNLNYVLGAVGDEIKALGRKWHEKIPPISCLVVNKHTKAPQRGIGFYMQSTDFRKLSRSEQRQMLDALNGDIWNYPRWNKVLRHFNLSPASPGASSGLAQIGEEAKYGKVGGETEDHRLLKEYVAKNPAKIGLPAHVRGETEYRFLSSDTIDVLFKSSPVWIGVEVKGVRSDEADILRGIFQCVKYEVLIEAMQRYEQAGIGARVILVLGGKLPPTLRRVVGLLKIEVVEEIAYR